MWLLVLVLVFHPVNWPADQPRPMMEYVIEYDTREQCLAARDWWVANGEAQPPGVNEDWSVLLQECEPVDVMHVAFTTPQSP